jgi:effector-binding domain-containing protein
LQAASIETKGKTLTVWRPPQDGKMDYAPGVFVPEGFQASGAVSLFTLPAGRAAHLSLRGSFAGLPQAWGQLFAGLAKIGAAPAGLNWEVYGVSEQPPEETETDLYALLT